MKTKEIIAEIEKLNNNDDAEEFYKILDYFLEDHQCNVEIYHAINFNNSEFINNMDKVSKLEALENSIKLSAEILDELKKEI